MKARANLLILAATGLFLAGCGTDQPSTPTPAPTSTPTTAPSAQNSTSEQSGAGGLPGTSWSLTSLGGQSPVRGTTVTLNFGIAGKATGNDGCNSYSTTYTSDATTVKIETPAAATLKACATPIMDQATSFTKALGDAATYKIDRQQQLTLDDSGGKELAVFAAQSSDLAGTSWIVTSYNNGKQAVVSVMNGTTITANFGKDGNVSGSGGCNDYSATYTISGKNSIKVGPTSATQKACATPQGVMEQETAYLTALDSAATYSVDGNQMEMRTADNAIAVSFTKAPPTSSSTP